MDAPRLMAVRAGKHAATNQQCLTTDTLRRLRADPDYWQAFHDARPEALALHNVTFLEDPTRGGGWCVAPFK